MIEINLLPGGGRKSRRGASALKLPAALSSLRGGGGGSSASFKDPWLVAAVVCAVLSIGSLGALYYTQNRREAELTEAVERAVADSTRYAGVLRDRVRAEATRDTVLRQLNIIRAVDGERFIWPHVLDELSRALPPYTWLTGVTYAGSPQGQAARQIVSSTPAPVKDAKAPTDSAAADSSKKSAPKLATAIPVDTVQIRISGQTVDIQALTRFMRDLEQSPFIERVQLEKSELVLVENKEATQFSLLALYSRPDSTAMRRAPLVATTR